MWYVIQVMTGQEEKIIAQCQKRIGEKDAAGSCLKKCFLPYTKKRQKYRGEWHTGQRLLFPGYVFLISDNPKELYLQLKNVQGLTKLLGCGDEIVPISQEEEKFLKRLGGENQVVELSVGIIEKGQVIITDGPLRGMEGCIKKIDRHKRTAWLEVEMMGRQMEVRVGVEIVEKR